MPNPNVEHKAKAYVEKLIADNPKSFEKMTKEEFKTVRNILISVYQIGYIDGFNGTT